MFYCLAMRAEYRLEPCKTALTTVRGMPFKWSLNPYMGCAHRCTFCYVRHFEHRADRPSGDEYGRSIRAKTNVAEVLRRKPDFSIRAEMPHYRYPADAEHLREGLLKAGLPE